MKIINTIIALAVFLLASSAMAGDLSVDNLTVSKDAAVYGTLSMQFTAVTTNGASSATGGTITTNGNYIIHTFTNVGTTNFVVSSGSLTCDVLIVAGGGGGGIILVSQSGGGGGAGGVINTTITVSAETTVVIGNGGAVGGDGSNSVFGSVTAFGGGAGGNYNAVGPNPGGSGGGGGGRGGTPWDPGAIGTDGQGYAGGSGGYYSGGGGGGSAETGHDGAQSSPHHGGPGGDGISNNITGTFVWYGGGGGGSAWSPGNQAAGGLGGGGYGNQYTTDNATAGGNNTGGGGGGGAGGGADHSKVGGSGIVIVRYPINSSGYTNITTLTISSNGINQASVSGSNVFMSKVGIGTNNPAEKLHVVGNVQVDGTNIVSAIKLGGETRTTWPTGNLSASNNLSDITDQAAARTNLGLGSAATNDASAFLAPSGDGSQITGITAAQVGALSTNAGALIAANNLSELTASAATARSNLGLGTAATNEASAFLSTTGGVVNGSLDIQYIPPKGDFVMGSYTNQ